MNSKSLKLSLFILGFVSFTGAYAQDGTSQNQTYLTPFSKAGSFNTWSIGVHGGILTPVIFYGKNDFTHWNVNEGYGAYINKQISPAFGIKADFFRGELEGDNTDLQGNGQPIISPYSSFKTQIEYAGSIQGSLTLANIQWMNRRSVIQPYLTAGAGLMGYHTELTSQNGSKAEYTPGKNIRELFIPVGVGLKFGLSKAINLDLGYTANFVDGDNLDGYHSGSQNDKFSYTHIGLEFSLGPKSKPALSKYNPVAAMENDYITRNAQLNAQLETERANNAAAIAKLQQEWKKFQTDSDNDGVADFYDKCPATPTGTQVDGSGCPLKIVKPVIVVTEEDKRVVDEAIHNLEFDFGKSTIRAKSYPSLDRVAELLKTKDFSLKLAGHTDNVGSDASNLKLSKERAEAIKAYLVSQGVNPSRVEATGYGESQPIADNTTEAGRQKNRRVEFTLY